jgi:hypothetical protein
LIQIYKDHLISWMKNLINKITKVKIAKAMTILTQNIMIQINKIMTIKKVKEKNKKNKLKII